MTALQSQHIVEIKPQAGPQEVFLSTRADIAVFGGSAGAGKTWAELLEPLRHITSVKGFGAVIFRRTSPQIRNEGGLWDESAKLYPLIGARPKDSTLEWIFPPHNNRVKFQHLEHDKNIFDHQGAQYPLVEFDELTHFSETQFFYLLGRNRSTCGVRPYIRATTNPDPDSWVREFLAWWIGEDGFPIPERSGKLRWFVRINDALVWADSKQELIERFASEGYGDDDVLSVTFISATIYDNPKLMLADPGYMAKLRALPRVERERLLGGNWDARAKAGTVFARTDFDIVPAAPIDYTRRCRAWDLAATPDGKDWTVGVLMCRGLDGRWYIEDVVRDRLSASGVRKLIKNTASQDGNGVMIRLPQDPGQAGKSQAQDLTSMLSGYVVRFRTISKNKYLNAQPLAAQAQAGNVSLVEGKWNKTFMGEAENFDGSDGGTDDQIDSASDAFNELSGVIMLNGPQVRSL
jgi:predicted phage terminase large subunit-like protein